MNFKNKGAYKKWLGYIYSKGLNKPGGKPVTIAGHKHKVKRPEGGPVEGDLQHIVIPSGTAITSNNQGQGVNSSMADILKDPYAFSYKQGITTLTKPQWNKLLPEQQQAIWRQGLSKMGFTQTGNNTFQNFDLGGSIGSAAGMGLNFLVPGLGAVASPLLGALGSAIDKSDEKSKISVASPVAKTIDPYGVYADGGSLSQSLLDAQIYIESRGKADAKNAKSGAMGAAQFMPETWDWAKSMGWIPKDADPFNADQSKQAQKSYMGWIMKQSYVGGDVEKALAAYNWGPGNVQKAVSKYGTDWKSHLPSETSNYIKDIISMSGEPTSMGVGNTNNTGMVRDSIAGMQQGVVQNTTGANTDMRDFIAKGQMSLNKLAVSGVGAPTEAKLEYGGEIGKNIIPLAGGGFDDLGSNILLAKGNSHKKGGIDVDVKGLMSGFDGVAEAEIEGGEPVITDAGESGYVINKDIAKPYIKMLQNMMGRKDSIANNTRNFIKQEMMTKNEEHKGKMESTQYKKGGKLYSYADGDPLPTEGITPMIPSLYPYNDNIPGIVPSSNPLVFPTMGQSPLDTYLQNPVANSTLSKVDEILGDPYKTMLNTPQVGTARTTTDTSGYTTSPTSGTQSGRLGATTGDWLQLAGVAIPTAYNLARGLFGKAEVEKPIYNEYENKSLNLLRNRTYNQQAIQNQLDRTFSAGRRDVNNLTSSTGVRLSNIQNLYSNLGQQRASIDLQGQQINNQYKADLAQGLSSFGQQRQQANQIARSQTLANQATKDQYLSEGVTNLGQGLTALGKSRNTVAMNNLGLKMLNNAFPNYYFNSSTLNGIMSGNKPSWMSDSEFEQAQLILHRTGF